MMNGKRRLLVDGSHFRSVRRVRQGCLISSRKWRHFPGTSIKCETISYLPPSEPGIVARSTGWRCGHTGAGHAGILSGEQLASWAHCTRVSRHFRPGAKLRRLSVFLSDGERLTGRTPPR